MHTRTHTLSRPLTLREPSGLMPRKAIDPHSEQKSGDYVQDDDDGQGA